MAGGPVPNWELGVLGDLLQEQLYYAARDGDAAGLAQLLRQPFPPNYALEEYDNRTALHLAIENGHLQCMDMLLDAGADANLQAEGKTPLHFAVYSDNPDAVQHLLDRGADASIRTVLGKTPVHLAAEFGAVDCLRHLLAAGCECLSTCDASVTPLMLAAQWGETLCAEMLLDAGAPPDPKDLAGNSAVFFAASISSLPCIRLLVQRGALLNDYNSGDDTPFLIAASVDDGQARNLVSDVLQYLASAGARATRPARDLLAQPEHCARLEAAARGARARRDFLDSCFVAAAEERVRAVVRSFIPNAEREQAADAAAAAGLAEAELSSEEIREVFLRRVSPLARAVAAEMAAKHLGNSALEDLFSTWSQPLADEIAQFRSLRTSRGREPTKSKIAARFALGAARVAKCQQAEIFFAGEARRLRSGLEIEREEANKNSRRLQEMLDPEQ